MKRSTLVWVATLLLLAIITATSVSAAAAQICYNTGVNHSNTTNIQVDGQGSGNYSCAGPGGIVEGFDYDDLGDRHINSIRCIDTNNVITSQNLTYVQLTVDGKNSCGSGKVLTGVTYVDKDGNADDYVSHIICKDAANVSTNEYLLTLSGLAGDYYTVYSDSTNTNVGWAITAVNQNRNPQFNLRGFYAARINLGEAGEGVQECVQSAICETGYEPVLKATKTIDSTKTGTAGAGYRNGFNLPKGEYVLELDQGAWSRWNSDSVDTTTWGGAPSYTWSTDVNYRFSTASNAQTVGILGFGGFYKNASTAQTINDGYLQFANITYQSIFGNNIWVWIEDNPITDNRNAATKPTVKVWQCNKIPACRDGVDNDNDTATDWPADFSCSSENDTSESSPLSQCQDGIDNDGDGVIDLADPGCLTNQGNNESSATTQCQDNIDNDNDSLTDTADPGCWSDPTNASTYDKTLNNESVATAQCQDGKDNDNDGAIDYPNDFSCSAVTDNDETNPFAQCQDGIDNDGDGVTDLADPGCLTNQGNNESSATTQCQDGIDNDADTATDAADPGCWTDPNNSSTYDRTRNNESVATIVTQCNDGIDNDNDGAIDYPADFSCSSSLDNDETLPLAQCQDGIDNDGDGVIDLADPGCLTNQGNNESSATTQCQDGIDNDNDFSIDSADPGCWSDPMNSSTYDRTINDESLARHLDVTNVVQTPSTPSCSADVQICADIINNTAAIGSVRLNIASSTGVASFAMSKTSGNTYCKSPLSPVSLAAFDGLNVTYQIFANDTSGNNDTETGSFKYDCREPEARIDGPFTCDEGQSVTFNASESNDSVDMNLDFAWDLDSDGDFDDATGETVSFMCVDDGTYDVSVQVLDDAGNNDTATSNANVSNVNPVANANGAYTVNSGYTVALSGTTTDAGTADTHTFTWDLDNDSTFETTGANPVFACSANATFRIALKVIDDDGGSDIDRTTVTCMNITLPPANLSQCNNGLDDDGDNLIDLADPGCVDANDTDETDPVTTTQCSDGIDNDGDNLVDLNDPDCSSPTDNDESGSGTVTQCSDNLDNDGDGLIDLADPDCSDANDNSESGTNGLTECSDGVDNDGDGDIDYPADAHCKNKADDRERKNTNSGGGGGSSDNQCIPNWSCSAWSACEAGIQQRTCNDQNSCSTMRQKPVTTRVCEVPTEVISLGGASSNTEGLVLNGGNNAETLLNPARAINNNTSMPWYLLALIIGIILLILLILIAIAARN